MRRGQLNHKKNVFNCRLQWFVADICCSCCKGINIITRYRPNRM